MSEKFNEALWKKELDELDRLPGETWDGTAAWEKVEQRLAPKHRTRKLAWYWTAAASLLLVLSMQWILKTPKEQEVVKHEIAKPGKANALKQMPEEKNIEPLLLPVTEEQMTVRSTIKKKRTNAAAKISIQLHAPKAALATHMTSDSLAKEIIDKRAMAAIIIPQVSSTPQKKTLKVVHLNELGQPVEQKKGLAQVRGIASGRSFTDEAFTNTNTADDNIIKIKLSNN